MKNKIKKMIILFKKYLGEIILISGMGLFVHNILNFSHQPLPLGLGKQLTYYYSSDTILWASIGAMLIIGGILIIKNKSK